MFANCAGNITNYFVFQRETKWPPVASEATFRDRRLFALHDGFLSFMDGGEDVMGVHDWGPRWGSMAGRPRRVIAMGGVTMGVYDGDVCTPDGKK